MSLTLSKIFIYPIKSLGGISLYDALVEQRGLQYDRRMMIVDKNGVFITQRDFPQMALLKTNIADNILTVFHSKSKHSITLPLIFNKNVRFSKMVVRIWDDICEASVVSKEANEFFSDMLGTKCTLVYMPENVRRIVDPKKQYVNEEHTVSFADGYPFLMIGQSSLDELNRRLQNPLPINRFRPNFVFTGGQAFEEDGWTDFLIGQLKFRAVKPCARCVITTTDQDTAERNDEPLKTLATFRRNGNKVLFGMNLVVYESGRVKVGDNITLF